MAEEWGGGKVWRVGAKIEGAVWFGGAGDRGSVEGLFGGLVWSQQDNLFLQ